MYSKPITENMHEKCNKIYRYLKQKGDYATNEELGFVAGIKSERSVRECVEIIADRHPIIATSDRQGYKLATKLADLEGVEHTWKELDSRESKIHARKLPLIWFREKCKKGEIK